MTQAIQARQIGPLEELKALQAVGHRINVCAGLGVDSTAMLLALHDHGIKPDLITFADTGGEKPETLQYRWILNHWLAIKGWPLVQVCKKATLPTTPYNDLGGNCTHNETLPSLAFGMKSCSIKWKQGPQDNLLKGVTKGPNQCEPHPLWLEAQSTGRKIIKLIGYDNGKADIRRSSKVKTEDNDFLYRYPLQSLGWARPECVARIEAEGLPVPVKSACYFCPASQKWELFWLAGTHPDLFLEALKMEHTAMLGKHSRWDKEECNYGEDWLEIVNTPSKQWPSTSCTVGLGRKLSWNRWAREEGIVAWETGEFIADRAHCLKRAKELQGQGGNACDSRTC